MDKFSALTKDLNRAAPALELREREPMRGHTSFRVGGPVRLMALPRSEGEAEAAVRAAAALGITPFFMGNGTNLLVSDSGWEGFVIKTFDGLDGLCAEGEALIAGSGVLLSRLANFALERGLTGLEFAHGIPGSLGGAVTMDAGAYGGEMRQVVAETEYLDADGSRGVLRGEEHAFGYRRSAFSGGSRLILRARLELRPGDGAEIRARMDELMAKRKSKQPLDVPSAGSTFKRPEGYFAAALIEECGLKGFAVGGAQVSEKHAGFVVNRGGASCADVLAVVEHVRETVLRRTGVELEPEIKPLGFAL
ncbi:UDP-N-acetylenolpyruvoylglucosamine reductase [Oscillospiraceae bacterium]|nr:UDP-N-acetylenolpyruvoylglucosamine reductase [Oscillospiraceae bacterium]BDF75094.1 UDP-N-acetylenolpyruvoylglucosamine reductase [Oscillospiraceae bacterium]